MGASRPDDRETVVAFSLWDLGESTALTVDQGPFATEGRRALHEQGWTDSTSQRSCTSRCGKTSIVMRPDELIIHAMPLRSVYRRLH
jgi:hypothetical protein